MKKIFILFFAVIFLSGAKLFNAHEFYLENGLRLIVVENNKAPIVKQMLWYNVGAADESLSAKGSAHLLEHLMFRGNSYHDYMQKNGVKINAFTSQDFTVYHAFMDVSKLELALYLEAKRMKSFGASNKDFLLERDIVLQERKQVVENTPMSKFYETLNKSFWQENPYSFPITGLEGDIINLQKSDVVNLYEKYYLPNNATLVLAGNIKPAVAYELVKKYFGKIKPKDLEPRKEYEFGYVKNAYFAMNIPEVETPRFVKKYLAPKNSYALDVFAKYLAGGKTSYLYQTMVEEEKMAIEVNASYNGLAKYGTSFEISVLPLKSFVIDKFVKQALEDFDAKKLMQTKQKMTSGLVYVKDNPEDEAYILGYMAAAGLTLEEIEAYEENINAVTLEQVKKEVWDMLNSSSLQGEVGI